MIKYIKKRWKSSSLLILIIFINSLFNIFSAYMLGNSFNKLLESNLNKFIIYASLSALSMFLFVLFSAFRIRYENNVIQNMISDIRKDIMKNISKSEYDKFYNREIGTYISWLNNDLLIVEQKGFASFFKLITIFLETLLSIFALITFHWSIIVFTIITSLLTLYLPKLLNSRIQESSQNYSMALEKSTSKYSNYLNGFDTLLSYNKLNLLEKISKEVSLLITKKSNILKKNISIAMFLGGISNLFSQIGILILSGFLISLKIINFGAILTIESLTGTVFNSLSNILDTFININVVKPIFYKFEGFNIESNFKENNKSNIEVDKINSLTLNNLVYKYEDKTVINNFNYMFEPNKKYAFIGKSGSGKTTLLNILSLRLNDYSGDYKINNINVKNIEENSLFEKIAYVSQNSYIFSDTLRFNITLGDNISDEEIIKNLKELKLEDLLEEDGLNLILKENGKNLSGGQKQRIALARALIRNKSVLLLDEVTSSLDKENAILIENMVLNNKNLTVIMISHNITEKNKLKFDYIIEFPV